MREKGLTRRHRGHGVSQRRNYNTETQSTQSCTEIFNFSSVFLSVLRVSVFISIFYHRDTESTEFHGEGEKCNVNIPLS